MWKAKGRLISLLSVCLAALLTLVLGVATMNVQPKTALAAETTTKYTFSSYTAGTQYAENEEHVLDEKVTIVTTQCHFTTQLRIYSSGTHNGYAIIKAMQDNSIITGLGFNAGNKVDTLNIYGSNDEGNTWTSIQAVSITSTSYKDYTVDFSGNTYKWLKLDVAGTQQVRVASITLTTVDSSSEGGEENPEQPTCEHANTTTTTTDATCTEAGSIVVTCDDCGETISTEKIDAPGHNFVDGSCSVCGEEEPKTEEHTLTFNDTTNRVSQTASQQVWSQNGITFTNNKASSTNNIINSSNPVRLYANSEIIVECAGMTKIVFNCNTESYATALKKSIEETEKVTATVNGKVVTVVFNEAVDSFTVAKLSAQVRMDSIAVIAEGSETPEQPECTHTNTTINTTDATCTVAGSTTVTCNDCGVTVSTVEIPALGHNYVDNFCKICGVQDPATIDYSGYYYISFTHGETVYYADNSELNSNRYYAITEQPSVEPVAAKYVYRLVKTGMNEQLGVYSLYEVDGDCYQENVIVEKEGDVYHFYATVGEDECQFLLNAGSTTKYIKFYKKSNATQSNYAQDITLTPVEVANIKSASVTLSDNIEVNYYATISDGFVGDVVMQYTVGDEGVVYDTEGVKQEDGRYKFTFKLPPQYMADVIDLKIVYDDFVLDSMEYSIKTYAQNQLNNDPSDELKQLLTDMLYYGAAAQRYVAMQKGVTVEDANLAMNGVENLGTASTAKPDSTNFNLENNTDITSYPAYFTGATVWFDNVNRIRVKINTTANVALTINGVAVEVTGTTIDTEGILATQFAETYTFVLSHNGVVMQTLTYSINAYAYAKKDDAKMSELALALYNYGISAKAYAPYAN